MNRLTLLKHGSIHIGHGTRCLRQQAPSLHRKWLQLPLRLHKSYVGPKMRTVLSFSIKGEAQKTLCSHLTVGNSMAIMSSSTCIKSPCTNSNPFSFLTHG